MRRPLIHQNHTGTKDSLILPSNTKTPSRLSGVALEKRLRQKRSSLYVETMAKLDAGDHHYEDQRVQDVLNIIKKEFPDVYVGGLLLGIVATCYLGNPYEVHTLDTEEQIITHYKQHEPLPAILERARNLAMHPAYVCIEVYPDYMRAIKKNGDVAVVKG